MKRAAAILFLILFFFSGCRTYYRKNQEFNSYFQQGDLQRAEKVIANDKKAPKRNTKLLYYLNRGTVAFMLGKYAESNEYFETALTLSETIEKNYFVDAASLLTNPNILPYKGESFELLMVHYYKALNYLYLHDYDAALVECRRMNEKLQVLGDKYTKDNRYKHDAFIHTLMGLIYDADKDYNNAFIAYRNAYNIYQDDYNKLYGITAPEQLKKDLLRAAYRTGLPQEVAYYEKEFGMKFTPPAKNDNGDVVFFWLNGLGPVKDEWSVNFTIVRGQGSYVTFVNEEYGWSFPFYYQSDEKDPNSGLGQLEFVRVVLPKYVERPLVYTNATLIHGDEHRSLELAEDVNKIAFQSLQDRMLRELGQSLLRLALKKAAEYRTRKENEDLGAAVGIINFITEQADTRNWQTLPHSIYYTRMELPAGEQQLQLTEGGGTGKAQTFDLNIKPGQTVFKSFHTLNALPAGYANTR